MFENNSKLPLTDYLNSLRIRSQSQESINYCIGLTRISAPKVIFRIPQDEKDFLFNTQKKEQQEETKVDPYQQSHK